MYIGLERLLKGELLLPPAGPAVERRMRALLGHMGVLDDATLAEGACRESGCLVVPRAGLFLAGTACPRSLLIEECQVLAQAIGLDVVVLRYDAPRGVTFDVKLRGESKWRSNHVAGSAHDELVLLAPDRQTLIRRAPTNLAAEELTSPHLRLGGPPPILGWHAVPSLIVEA